MTFAFDPAVRAHARALELLDTREIGWLATNGRNGYPHAVPVWFVWHDGAVLTFSQPHAAKARNLEADRRAPFQLETSEDGEEWLLLQGDVEILAEPTAVWIEAVRGRYLEKYQTGLDALGWPLERIIDDFSLALAFRPHKLIS